MNDVCDILMLELKHWFSQQFRNEWNNYYLYCLPATAKHNGRLMITKEIQTNPDYCRVERIRKDWIVEQNHQYLVEFVLQLLILDARN